jgi:hypothetical protein
MIPARARWTQNTGTSTAGHRRKRDDLGRVFRVKTRCFRLFASDTIRFHKLYGALSAVSAMFRDERQG